MKAEQAGLVGHRFRDLDSLKQAEARVRSGKAIDYDPKTFKDRLVGIYRGSKR